MAALLALAMGAGELAGSTIEISLVGAALGAVVAAAVGATVGADVGAVIGANIGTSIGDGALGAVEGTAEGSVLFVTPEGECDILSLLLFIPEAWGLGLVLGVGPQAINN